MGEDGQGAPLNILWVSDPVTCISAYGQQTALVLPRLRAAGHNVALFAGYAGSPTMHGDIPVLPHAADPFGNDVAEGHARLANADAVITLIDPHVCDPDVYVRLPWCAWAPIDCSPVAPKTVRALKAACWIWTPSRFGEQQLRAAGVGNVSCVPHGVDSGVFKPTDRPVARAALSRALEANLGGKFLVAMNAANKSNPSRKGFYEAFSAFKRFSDRQPEAILYVHAEATGVYGGENLPAIGCLVGLDPSKVIYAPQYQYVCGMLGQDYLAAVYNAADVYLSASHGEGFGLPAIEAEMCGCPVILPANSSQPETCLAGWTVQCERYMPFEGATWERPDSKRMAEMLNCAFERKGDDALRTIARERALVYDAARVFDEHMKPALERIAGELR